MNRTTYCLRCGGAGLVVMQIPYTHTRTCPVCLGDGKPTHKEYGEIPEKPKYVQMKALCRVCYDGYGDEEFSFGRCCGSTMVEVPKHMWDELDGRASREEINELIAKHGKPLFQS